MATFEDRERQEWTIELPFGEILRIKAASEGKFDLLDPHSTKLAERLDDDLLLFWELLAHLTHRQQLARGIDAEAFGLLMTGDCLLYAQRSFFREWSDFFRQLQRHDIAVALETIARLKEKTIEKIRHKIESSEELKQLDQRASKKIDRLLTSAFSDLRVSFDSILIDIPGETSGTASKESSDSDGPTK